MVCCLQATEGKEPNRERSGELAAHAGSLAVMQSGPLMPLTPGALRLPGLLLLLPAGWLAGWLACATPTAHTHTSNLDVLHGIRVDLRNDQGHTLSHAEGGAVVNHLCNDRATPCTDKQTADEGAQC